MARIKLNLPEAVIYTAKQSLRIADMNYGNHMGNEVVLQLAHEARLRFLRDRGFASETEIEGIGLIMSDAAIQFVSQGFYGMKLGIDIGVDDISRKGFDLYYHIYDREAENTIAKVKTGMVCFDYQEGKPVSIPVALLEALQ